MRFIKAMVRVAVALAVALAGGLALPSGTDVANADTSPCALPGVGWNNLGHTTDYTYFYQRPAGALRGVMLFVDFPDHPMTTAPSVFLPSGGYYDYVGNIGSDAQAWFDTASYGQVDLQVTPVDRWYRMSGDAASYGMINGSGTFQTQRDYLQEVATLADADVNFSQYDFVYVMAAPRLNPPSGQNPYADFDWTAAFHGNGGPANGTTDVVLPSGERVHLGATFAPWALNTDRELVVQHETGHLFGLPDLYGGPFVGGWGVMGGDLGVRSPDFFAWEKWKFDWLADDQIACVPPSSSGTTTAYTLTPLETAGGLKAVVVPTGEYTADVVEYRTSGGNNAGTCDTGALVYQVNTATSTGPIRVHDSRPGQTGLPNGCGDLDVATFGVTGGRPTTYTSADANVTIQVTGADASGLRLTVTKGGTSTHGCRMTYAVTGSWPDGFQAEVTIVNTGSAPLGDWSASWRFPGGQTLHTLWGAGWTQQGAQVLVNPATASALAPGASVSLGFIASGSPPASLTSPTLAGTPCTTA
ncbi:M6 family metalloprotease domain-containing protein [Sphaerisporangium sp. TRM90804]|uniref:M6 family metalloprotease domain-containing protein n=1 Tax=Sphaerisporangium sp. TRM90804 TaxID=3031113 RepID=UPI002447E236|nr:M6 family metalloprotease domain-containing protein [Sphaerisporangium sp. TRM90804]MDH2426692.1 M6 family metalloprotease domain-containing protein [Sphaerisporangium sp. TRM90804]